MLPTPSVRRAPSEADSTSELMMCSVRRAGLEDDTCEDVRDVVERFDDGRGGIVERFDDERYVVERFDDRSDIVDRFGDGRDVVVDRVDYGR